MVTGRPREWDGMGPGVSSIAAIAVHTAPQSPPGKMREGTPGDGIILLYIIPSNPSISTIVYE
jgi:hypothetical protein